MNADLLYLSFDGMTDPLGRSQVLPYLTGLAARGHRIRLVSLEKPLAYGKDREKVLGILTDAGIEWHPLRYWQRPPILSTMLNLRLLRRRAERLHRERPADFVHCRADLPAIAGLSLKRRFGLLLLYDMRAFWADERAEGGAWNQANPFWRAIFRYFKFRQRELLASAEEMVVLSEEGRKAVEETHVRDPSLPITIIPCCADFELFAPPSVEDRAIARAELGIDPKAPLLIHVGSIGCNCLLGEMLDFFDAYHEMQPNAQFLFLAPTGAEAIRAAAEKRELAGQVQVRSAPREEIPRWIGAADLGIMFVRPVWSKRAASPTKLGEMLAVGLPVISNSGVGDVAEILTQSGAGIAVSAFNAEAYRTAIGALGQRAHSSEEIRAAARRWFDLANGIALYDRIYRRIVEPPEAATLSTSTTRGA